MDYKKLVKDLYIARERKKHARQMMISTFEEIGECEFFEDSETKCYRTQKIEWCAACKKKQPVYDEYKKLSYVSGAALRKVLIEGKKLAKEES